MLLITISPGPSECDVTFPLARRTCSSLQHLHELQNVPLQVVRVNGIEGQHPTPPLEASRLVELFSEDEGAGTRLEQNTIARLCAILLDDVHVDYEAQDVASRIDMTVADNLSPGRRPRAAPYKESTLFTSLGGFWDARGGAS